MSVGRMSRSALSVLFVSLLVCMPLGNIPDLHAVAGETTNEPLDERGDELRESSENSWWKFRHDLNNTGASSSPATNVNEPLWIRDLGAPITASPAIMDGVVYVGNMKSKETRMFAVNAFNGEIVWEFQVEQYIKSSAAVADGMVFFGDRNGTYNFHALNTTDGSEAWYYDATNGVHGSPAVSDGTVFFGSMITGSGDPSIYALDEYTGAEIWTYTVNAAIESTPVVYDGVVYIGTAEGKGRMLALDEYGSGGTTSLIWSYECPIPISWVETAPVLANGILFFGSRNGYFYAVDMDGMFDGDQGIPDDAPFNNSDLIWEHEFDSIVTASAAYDDGKIYLPNSDKLYVLNASADSMSSEERLLWTFQAGGYIGTSPAIADNKIFFGSGDNHLYAIHQETGKLIWKYETGGSVASPAVGEGFVVVGSSDGKLYGFNVTGKPDLTLFDEDIQFTPSSTVLQGTNVTIAAKIRNNGDAASDSGLITLYKGPPPFGYQLGTRTVGYLEPLESETVSLPWTPLVSGSIEVCVEISDVIPEEATTENNLACSHLNVVGAPDLTLSPFDIEFVPSSNVMSGTDVTIFATIHNIGDNISDSASVTIYDGNPDDGGAAIGSRILQNIKPGTEQTIWTAWASPSVGAHSIFVAISDSLPPEVNLSNNLANRTLTVVSKPDLSISPQDIEFVPSEMVINGTPVLITATVHNLGGSECDSALVEFFDGDPSSGGVLIASRYVSNVPAQSGQTVSAYWVPATAGISSTYVRISDAVPEESDLSNNIASGDLEVFLLPSSFLPDLSVSWADISFSDVEPLEGEEIAISVLVHNIGQEDATDVVARVFDGTTQIGADQTIGFLAGGGGSSLVEIIWTPDAGTHMITVVLDPNGTVSESDESNNVAQSILVTMEKEEKEVSDFWWIAVVIVTIAVLAILAVILLRRRKREHTRGEDPSPRHGSS